MRKINWKHHSKARDNTVVALPSGSCSYSALGPTAGSHALPAVREPPRQLMMSSTDGRSPPFSRPSGTVASSTALCLGLLLPPLLLPVDSFDSAYSIRSCAVMDAAASSVREPHKKIFLSKCSRWLHTSAPLRRAVGSNGLCVQTQDRHG